MSRSWVVLGCCDAARQLGQRRREGVGHPDADRLHGAVSIANASAPAAHFVSRLAADRLCAAGARNPSRSSCAGGSRTRPEHGSIRA